MNALIPAWIIGAPLLLAIVDLLRTPRPGSPSSTSLSRAGSAA